MPDAPQFMAEIALACGHGWRGGCESEAKAQEFLELCIATNDTAYCSTCKGRQLITGPIRQSKFRVTKSVVVEADDFGPAIGVAEELWAVADTQEGHNVLAACHSRTDIEHIP